RNVAGVVRMTSAAAKRRFEQPLPALYFAMAVPIVIVAVPPIVIVAVASTVPPIVIVAVAPTVPPIVIVAVASTVPPIVIVAVASTMTPIVIVPATLELGARRPERLVLDDAAASAQHQKRDRRHRPEGTWKRNSDPRSRRTRSRPHAHTSTTRANECTAQSQPTS